MNDRDNDRDIDRGNTIKDGDKLRREEEKTLLGEKVNRGEVNKIGGEVSRR